MIVILIFREWKMKKKKWKMDGGSTLSVSQTVAARRTFWTIHNVDPD